MTLRKCAACGNGAGAKTKECPQCGERGKNSISKITVAIVCAIGALIVCTSVLMRSSTLAKMTSATEPARLQIVKGDERKLIMEALTKNLELNRDKMKSISFFKAKGANYSSSGLDAYLTLPDDRLPILRMRPMYFGANWVFVESIKIMADNAIVYERSFKHGEISRDNIGGMVREAGDYAMNSADVVALKFIASAKSATIRFSGSDRKYDHEITKTEQARLGEIISAYEYLTARLQKPA